MSRKKIKIMDTSFRDGFQSVYGARVFYRDFFPALEAALKSGITHFEVGGGARFQSPLFYCNEDPFEMMDEIRKLVGPDINLQTLARGVNVVGLESQTKDVINLHAKMFKKHGMTTIRNFDALNDVNNLIYSGQCIKDNGLKHEVTVTMMGLPLGCVGAHDPDFYEKVLKNILDAKIPFDSVAFKDASGTSTPQTVYETVKRARKMLPAGTHIRFHSHETAGTGLRMYLAAIEGGADGVDLAMKPVSGGTSQPDIISFWHALRGTDYDLDIDIQKVIEAEEVFKSCMKDYFLPPEATTVDPMIVFSPMPGGALTANTQMMRDNGVLDKYPEVIKAMTEVVKKGGFGTSVTPVSQFYFQQAFNNVIFGPWKKIADGYGKMVLGYFGKTPCTPDAEIVKIAAEQLKLEPTTEKVIDINEKDPKKGIVVAKKLLEDAGLPQTEENIFIAAACKDKGITFLKGEATTNVRKNMPKKEDKKVGNGNGVYEVTVNENSYNVKLEGDKAFVNSKEYSISVKEGTDDGKGASSTSSASGGSENEVKAPLAGTVVNVIVKEGDTVSKDTVLLVMEAMKMETEIKSPFAGKVTKVLASKGNQVSAGQVLVCIK